MNAVEHSKKRSSGQTEQDPRWQKVLQRDRFSDGEFVYSVKTTGVYCRPSCGAKTARAENVAFHITPNDAELAGFRPCKRCKPDEAPLSDQYASMVAESCRLMERTDAQLSLAELASAAGLSAYHFHRIFKSITGLTPKAYSQAKQADRMRQELRRSGSVTEAIYQAGFNTSARFYAKSDSVLGMSATSFRKGGEDTTIFFAIGESSLGSILVGTTNKGVCAIFLGDRPGDLIEELESRFPHANLVGDDHGYRELVAKVVQLVEAPHLGTDLPFDIRGTAFQQRVWQALQKIPAGTVSTYSEVAKEIGSPTAVRAVASACAANALAVAIPCHRVVRGDGSLSGYRWGVERKRKLLARESL